MNIHHLELFYYVAKHGGISQAVRNIPYGIQQPAVSGQILQLEDDLGLTLFRRRPFALTPPGQELYRFIEPFFADVQSVGDRLRGELTQQLRVAAAAPVLRDHLPALLQNVRKRFPRLKLMLREALQPESEVWLQRQEIDLAVTVLEGKPPPGITAVPLLRLPLILLVHKSSRLKTARELWQRDRVGETLISLPVNEPVHRHFQRGLARLGVDWFPLIEVSSLDLVETYVANGFGVGLSVDIPKRRGPTGLRSLPLAEFEPIVIAGLWQGKLTSLTRAVLDELQARAQALAV
ncbi:MAG: LysR family transcriptional regulator [Verrucomicrobia bacterium]|nr:LysR family transcriptional regulator [Verrucomicrobiota bacterium]